MEAGPVVVLMWETRSLSRGALCELVLVRTAWGSIFEFKVHVIRLRNLEQVLLTVKMAKPRSIIEKSCFSLHL